jgi:hypothetical protein
VSAGTAGKTADGPDGGAAGGGLGAGADFRRPEGPGASVVTVPFELVAPLRDGLHADLQSCVDQISTAVRRRDRWRIRAEVEKRFDRAEPIRRLLDVVGWFEPEEGPPPVEVDLREHRDTLLQALRTQAKSESDVAADTTAPEAKRSAAAAVAGNLAAFVQQVEEHPR